MRLTQKFISQLVSVIFLLQIITPVTFAQTSVMQEAFDPDAYYDIVSNYSIYNSVPGSKLSWVGEELQILLGGGSILLAKKNIEQIRQVGADYVPVTTTGNVHKKSKRNTLLGLAIGAGAGAVIGIGLGFAIANTGNENSKMGDPKIQSAFILGSALFITSTTIGGVLGAFTKKKAKAP